MSNIWYVDFNSGNDSNSGNSFANRVKTLTRAAALAAAGDTVRVMGNASTKQTAGAVWVPNDSLVDLLESNLTQLLYGDGLWTASTHVTATEVTADPLPKQGGYCAQLACSSSFTTGKVAYWPTGSALNLSTFQQVSFWVQSSVALASGALSINLCSDTAGATIVNTLTLNQALNAGQWTNVTLNNAAALGSSIQSIRLTANSTLASKTIFIDNVLACLAASASNCLTLGTLVSPDNAIWYPIQSIDSTFLYLDFWEDTPVGSGQPYWKTSDDLYFLQTTQATIGSSSTSYAQTFSGSGTSGNQITISGGWDSTAMTTQVGWTSIDTMDWTESGINLTGNNGYVTVDHFNFIRCAYGLGLAYTEPGFALTNSTMTGFGSPVERGGILVYPTSGMTITSCKFVNGGGLAIDGAGSTITGCTAYTGVAGGGFNISGSCDGGFYNNSGSFTVFVDNFVAYNLTGAVGVESSSAYIYGLDGEVSSGGGNAFVYNWTPPGPGASPGNVLSERENGIVGDSTVYTDLGTATTTGVSPEDGNGMAWLLTPNANALSSSPLRLKVGSIACVGGVENTFSYYAMLSGTSVDSQFRIFGGRYPGVGSAGSDITEAVSGTSWTQYPISVTPTANCVVDVFFEAWGSTTQTAIVSGPVAITN